MKAKKVFIIVLIIFSALITTAPAFAASGYSPDYDDEKYDYTVSGPWISSTNYLVNDTGAEYVTIYETDKDDSTKVNSYQIKIDFTNVPSSDGKEIFSRKVQVYEDMDPEQFTAYIQTTIKSGFILNAGMDNYGIEITSWDQFVTTYKQDLNYQGATVGNLLGRPAFIMKHAYSAQIFLYLKEVELPTGTGALILPIEIYVTPLEENIIYNSEIVSMSPEGQDYFNELGPIALSSIEDAIANCEAMKINAYLYKINDKEITSDSEATASGSVDINTEASEASGETSYTVPAAIAVGLVSIVGAIGAAGAATGVSGAVGVAGTDASGSDGGAKEDDEEKSTYKMYVNKEFGNKIEFDKPAVTVYARMAEVKNGVEIDRSDMTQRIDIFSRTGCLKVSGQTTTGNYMGALVCAESIVGADNPKEGVVSFRFTGEGGTFQNNMRFMLTGEPYISFPERGDYLVPTVNMLFGDNGSYSFPVEFIDFVSPVDEVLFNQPDDLNVHLEAEKITASKYMIQMTNLSTGLDSKIFKIENYEITINAKNETQYAKGVFCVTLQPEGLSVRDLGNQFDNKGYFKVSCYPDADSKDSENVLPTRFALSLAVAEIDNEGKRKVKIIPSEQFTPVFTPLDGTSNETNTLVSRYPIEINPVDGGKNGIFRFEPKQSLPEPETTELNVVLPISAEYRGDSYKIELSIRLIGEQLNPMAGWDEEYAILQKRVARYGLSQDLAMRIRKLCQNRSTSELRLLNKMILIESALYYTKEAKAYNDIADRLQAMEGRLEMLKWFGDQAFSILMNVYAGPVGDAIITPAKEIVVTLIGEAGTQIFLGENIDFEKLNISNNISAAFENLILNMINEPNISLKKAGTVIAGFAVFNMVKHYALDVDAKGNRDFYKAITASFGDLTTTTIKIAAGKYFEKLAGNKNFAKKLDGYAGGWLRKHLPDIALQKPNKDILSGGLTEETAYILSKISILQKYVEEICGAGAAKVYSNLNQANEQADVSFDSTDYVLRIPLYPGTSGPESTIYASIDFMKVKNLLFDYIYIFIIGKLPLPSNTLNIPNDPPYMSTENV